MNYIYIHTLHYITYIHPCMHTHISHDLQVIDGFYLAPLLWFQRAPTTPQLQMQSSEATTPSASKSYICYILS